MSELILNVTHAFRLFARSPGFFSGLVLTLALGTGANASVFSIAYAVLLRPLPYQQPDSLVMLWRVTENPAAVTAPLQSPLVRGLLTGAMVCGSRAKPGVFRDVAAVQLWQSNLDAQFDLTLSDHAERLRGALASPNMFDILGVSADRGRLFSAGDEQSTEPFLVISYRLWQRVFAGDSAIIGRPLSLTVGRETRTQKTFVVIGVLSPDFRFTYPEETEAWALVPWNAVHCNRAIAYHAIARLAPDVSLDAAQAHLSAESAGGDRQSIPAQGREVIHLEQIAHWTVGDVSPTVLLLVSVALLLLVTTCATVAHALLVRSAGRHRELAIRMSLGADRRRLVRQLVTEGAVWVALGTLSGVLLAAVMTPSLRAVLPAAFSRADDLRLNFPILASAMTVAMFTTLACYVAPAWRAGSVDVAPSLRRTSSTASADSSTTRWRAGLVAGQSCIATVLLIGAGLLLVSMWRLLRVPLGFDGENVLTVEMRLLDLRYWPQGRSSPRELASGPMGAFQEQLVEQVRGLPGVAGVGVTSAVPFHGVDFTYLLNRVGAQKRYSANARFVDAGYFSVMRISLLRGRLFAVSDTAASGRVIIISESYARQMFGREDPLGQRIDVGEPAQVIGVVTDMRYQGYDKEPRPAVYLPRTQDPSELVCLVVRVLTPSQDVVSAIRQIVFRLDPAVPLLKVSTVEQIMNESIADRRFYTFATSSFGVLAFFLTVVGLVAVVGRFVVERQRELAIRAALGATPSRLIRLVLRHGLTPVLAGSIAGTVVVYLGARTIDAFLFQMASREPIAYIGAVLFVIATGATASLLTARQATRIEPALLLKAD